MKISTGKLGRFAVVVSLVGGSVVAALAAAAPAEAGVGTQPGHVTLSPSSDTLASSAVPSFATDNACPSGFTDNAQLIAYTLAGANVSAVSASVFGVNAPFTGNLQGSIGQFVDAGILNAGTSYEFVVHCNDAVGNFQPVQSTFVTIGASNWTSSATPPSGGVSTTTTLSANPTSGAPGTTITLNATVTAASGSPAGNVQFAEGGTALGSPVAVASGAASTTVSTLTCGPHSITAAFQPTDTNAFSASTSAPVTVTISGGSCAPAGSETINVNIPSTGAFTFTVSTTPVNLGTAAASGSNLEATGSLSPVTVQDTRNTVPGWSVSGQVGDFSDGSHTIDGNRLGWSPAITTPNAANDVTAGSAITAGANPGLKQGGTLGNAAAGHGAGQTTLGGGLDLVVPASTNPGSYTATLTITAIDTAA